MVINMVNIIINDGKELDDQLQLMQTGADWSEKYYALFTDLLQVCTDIRNQNKEILEAIQDSKGGAQVAPTQDKKKPVQKRGRKKKSTEKDKFTPIKISQELWKKLELFDDGRIVNYGHKTYLLPVDIHDLLYVMECDENIMTYGMFKRLVKKYHSNNNTFGKLIYNIREGNFKSIVSKYYEYLSNVEFGLDSNYLVIDGVKTNIHRHRVNEWINQINNTSKKQGEIMRIVSNESKEIDKDLIYLVCDNYSNDGLLKVVKGEVKSFSREQNVEMHGGIV